MSDKKKKRLSLGQTEADSRLPKGHFLKVTDPKIEWKTMEKKLNKPYPFKNRKT
jgi:hypothetical protein